MTPDAAKDFSVVIPAFNEARKIEGDLRAVARYVRERGLDSEIIVVDDGSDDATAAIAQDLRREIPEMQVLAYRPNRGKGYALRAGVAATRGRIVMFADAGLCVPYEDADAGVALLQEGVDIAVGSRRVGGARVVQAQPLHRRLGSQAFWLIVKASFPLPPALGDTQCGFKLFRGEVARALYARCITDRMMIDIDMLSRARRTGYTVAEFPVHWTNDPDTRFAPVSGSWTNLVELRRIWKDINAGRGRRSPP